MRFAQSRSSQHQLSLSLSLKKYFSLKNIFLGLWWGAHSWCAVSVLSKRWYKLRKIMKIKENNTLHSTLTHTRARAHARTHARTHTHTHRCSFGEGRKKQIILRDITAICRRVRSVPSHPKVENASADADIWGAAAARKHEARGERCGGPRCSIQGAQRS